MLRSVEASERLAVHSVSDFGPLRIRPERTEACWRRVERQKWEHEAGKDVVP